MIYPPLRASTETAATALCLAVLLLLSNASAGSPAFREQSSGNTHVWLGPDGNPLPLKNEEEVLEFLRTAEVVSLKDVPVGVTKPRQAVLEKDGVRSRAIFRDVDQEIESFMVAGRRERNVLDRYIFECAAYEMARLLEFNTVPPVVERVVDGKRGSLQIWLEGAMNEKERLERGVRSPDPVGWNKQMQTIRVFDALIGNWDRNQGNLLIDRDWRIWMVDHTRAFLRRDDLLDPGKLYQIERGLWQKLQSLDDKEVRERLKPYLTPREIDALLKRHRKLVSHYQAQIAKRGESDVLYNR